jgi:hypothetical protein
MIDADHQNIKAGLQFLQTWSNGKLSNSPNGIDYLFLPLYKKYYTDEERMKIITDHKHFLGTDSVVAIRGLKPLESLVKLASCFPYQPKGL